MKIYYQLTFFDPKENRRRKYLNGASFESSERAEKEFAMIKKEFIKKNFLNYATVRSKWALEVLKIEGRKVVNRKMVKMLGELYE